MTGTVGGDRSHVDADVANAGDSRRRSLREGLSAAVSPFSYVPTLLSSVPFDVRSFSGEYVTDWQITAS